MAGKTIADVYGENPITSIHANSIFDFVDENGDDAAALFSSIRSSILTNAPAMSIAQGTITDPAVGFAHSVTWNDGSDTFIGQDFNVTNTASGGSSLLARWRVNDNLVFSIDKTGATDWARPADGAVYTRSEISGATSSFYVQRIMLMNSGITVGGSSWDVALVRSGTNTAKITDGSSGTGKLAFLFPSSDPAIAGVWWDNAGTLTRSAG